MSIIRPYTISIPDSAIAQLAQKLSSAIIPDELDEADWEYGVPRGEVSRLLAHWRDKFNWRSVEARLNQLPNYTCTIQAETFSPLQIHFVHSQSKVANAIPLLFIHGCTSHFAL